MRKRNLLAAAVLAAGLTVTAAGCGDAKNDATWGTDGQTENDGTNLGEDLKNGAEEIGEDIKDGAEDLGDDIRNGTENSGNSSSGTDNAAGNNANGTQNNDMAK